MPIMKNAFVTTLNGTAPDSYSWKQYLAPVIDQGPYPTCYAHSVIVMAEGLYYSKHPELTPESFSMTRTFIDWIAGFYKKYPNRKWE